VTGGFGEPTCLKCHFDNSLNESHGSLAVDGVPRIYIPGREYELKVVLRRSGLKRGGFEMSARFAEQAIGAAAGAQAGEFRAPDTRVQIVTEPGKTIQYIQHTKTGSQASPAGQDRWVLTWIAPPDGRAPVRFDVAANAANDDASPLGDFIYVKTVVTRPAPAGR
jgi:hypothetical protein